MPKKALGISLLISCLLAVASIFALFANPFHKVEPQLSSSESQSRKNGTNLTENKNKTTDIDGAFLRALDAKLSSMDARLSSLEQKLAQAPTAPHLEAPPVANLGIDLPSGSEAPWAWMDKLDAGKRAAVERIFDEVASSVESTIPLVAHAGDPALEKAMDQLDYKIAGKLHTVLSAEEFNAYLSSLPEPVRERLGFAVVAE
jgi:hypothetical protein